MTEADVRTIVGGWLGQPYAWGGAPMEPGPVDCSGFVRGLFASASDGLLKGPRWTTRQWADALTGLPYGEVVSTVEELAVDVEFAVWLLDAQGTPQTSTLADVEHMGVAFRTDVGWRWVHASSGRGAVVIDRTQPRGGLFLFTGQRALLTWAVPGLVEKLREVFNA